MKVLIKNSNLPIFGPGFIVPMIGLVVDREKNLSILEKFIDPFPDIWDEEIKENEVILRVPMDKWKGEMISEYIKEFVKREGIV